MPSTPPPLGHIERLRRVPPRLWLYSLAGIALAACAGYVNVVVLSVGGPPVTHVSGSISWLGTDLSHPDAPHATHALTVALVIAAFGLGALISGYVIGDHHLRFGRRYGVAGMLEGLLLVAADLILPHNVLAGAVLAATAAGLQNAMASSFHGLIIRTTHMTGVLTDLGFLLGRALAGHMPEWWRPLLLIGLLGGFASGGVVGALAHDHLGSHALLIPALSSFVLGAGYFFWRLSAAARQHPGER